MQAHLDVGGTRHIYVPFFSEQQPKHGSVWRCEVARQISNGSGPQIFAVKMLEEVFSPELVTLKFKKVNSKRGKEIQSERVNGTGKVLFVLDKFSPGIEVKNLDTSWQARTTKLVYSASKFRIVAVTVLGELVSERAKRRRARKGVAV